MLSCRSRVSGETSVMGSSGHPGITRRSTVARLASSGGAEMTPDCCVRRIAPCTLLKRCRDVIAIELATPPIGDVGADPYSGDVAIPIWTACCDQASGIGPLRSCASVTPADWRPSTIALWISGARNARRTRRRRYGVSGAVTSTGNPASSWCSMACAERSALTRTGSGLFPALGPLRTQVSPRRRTRGRCSLARLASTGSGSTRS